MKTKICKGLIYNQNLKIKQRWKTHREGEDGSNSSTTPVKRCLMMLTLDEISVVNYTIKITTSIINYSQFSSSVINCSRVIFIKY